MSTARDALEELRYPVGRFEACTGTSAEERRAWIEEIAALPAAVRRKVSGLSAAQLDTPYRPGGWTVRQVVHHLPDSHMNSYIRFKLAVTEDEPVITAYDEGAWSELGEVSGDIGMSLSLLDALHIRWVAFLNTLADGQWRRAFIHPASGPMALEACLQLYAWHGRHHLAQIVRLRARSGW